MTAKELLPKCGCVGEDAVKNLEQYFKEKGLVKPVCIRWKHKEDCYMECEDCKPFIENSIDYCEKHK